MRTMVGRPATLTGARRVVIVPSPSWPLPLYPHAHTPPEPSSAREWDAPAAMAVTPDNPLTATADSRSVAVVPSPIWPSILRPQDWTLPSDNNTSARLPPAATATAAP